ncbi:hypothetical protein IT409_01005, partial [Candidatus Falkowbacteria bacterium]|nr:hypothetical protein [Candidatus Falkowbacteria bacterium]
NYDILVNTHTAFSDQIQKLKVVLSQEIKDNEKRLEYIDMRLGNNIYYKYK